MIDNVAGSQLELLLTDASASDVFGASLANALPDRGVSSAVLYFHGELGAGKTTCARSALRTLGVTGLIRSPTYTLVEDYPVTGFACVHVDLYRLAGERDVEELDLRRYLETPSLLLIEWAVKGGGAVPPPDLEVTLEYAHSERRATLVSRSAFGQRWFDHLAKDTSLSAYVSNLT